MAEVTPLAVRQFFAGLQSHSPSSQHQAYRTIKTFLRWCVEAGMLREDPLRGFTMRTPKTLPTVSTEDELRAVLATCPETLEGVRNRTLVLVLADAGLRASEVLHLLIEDWRSADRGLFVRAGKGRKDPRGLHRPDHDAGAERPGWHVTRRLRRRRSCSVTDEADPLKPRHLVQILHRLSAKGGIDGSTHTRSGTLRQRAGCEMGWDWTRCVGH